MSFDFTPVVISNLQAFAEQLHEVAALYAQMKPVIQAAVERDGRVVHSHSRSSERVHELGTSIERLDDVMPNLINNLVMFSEEPTVGGREAILEHRTQRGKIQAAGQLIDNAAREFTDPAIQDQLRAFDVRLHQLFHDVEATRPQVVGKYTGQVVAEDRGGEIKR